MRIIRKPRIALLSRDGTSANSFGQVWHYFEQELNYPVQILSAADLPQLRLNDYNVLILPEGRYQIQGSTEEKLADWIRSGGRLIAIGSAIQSI